MMRSASGVVLRRGSGRGGGARRPLRLEIRRRRAQLPAAGAEQFVTEVLFGERDAVLMPRSVEAVAGDRVTVVEA